MTRARNKFIPLREDYKKLWRNENERKQRKTSGNSKQG